VHLNHFIDFRETVGVKFRPTAHGRGECAHLRSRCLLIAHTALFGRTSGSRLRVKHAER